MTTGQESEPENHIVGFKEEISKAAVASEDEFFTWFNYAKNKDASFVRGSWDFVVHIAHPVAPYLTNPEDKIALEIGHGGGRILAAASHHFGKVVGIDIHKDNDKVSEELRLRGIDNFKLIQVNGSQIEVDDHSVDVVYSFIVLQHVEKIAIFEQYLQETYRILKPGGVAVLYFGRQYWLSHNRKSKLFYWFDRMVERVILPKGYREFPAKINSTNLRVTLSFARSMSKRIGFKVLANLVSRKRVPDGVELFGGQNGLLLKK